MKKIIIGILAIVSSFQISAQTGPGGVGNTSSNVLWIDVNGGPVTTDGQERLAYIDQSGNNVLFTSPTGPGPYYYSGIVNGKPVFRFSQDLATLSKTNFPIPTDQVTLFSVNTFTESNVDAIFSYASTTHDNDLLFVKEATGVITLHRATSAIGSNFTISDTNFHIYEASWNKTGGATQFWLDGLADTGFTGLATNTSITSGGTLALAGEQDAVNGGYQASQGLKGDVAEMIMYNNVINTAQSIIVNNYLGAKYGLTISNDYYAYNATHGDGVVGIGREDASNTHTASKSAGLLLIENPNGLNANQEYLFMGHDNASGTAWTGTESPDGGTYISRLAREWRIDETGDVGTIDFVINSTDLPSAPSAAKDMYVLLVDSDGDFSSGATVYEMTNEGSNIHAYRGYSPSSGEYIALGIIQPTVEHELVLASGSEEQDVIFNVNLNFTPSSTRTVEVNTTDLGAVAGEDYTAISGLILTFPVGNTTQSYTIPIINNPDFEGAELLRSDLSNPTSGLDLGTNSGLIYEIIDGNIGFIGPGGVGNANTNPLWVRPEELVGTTNLANVSQWSDVSGNDNHLTQTTSTNFQPQYITNVLNGFGIVKFPHVGGDADRLIHDNFNDFPTTEFSSFSVTGTSSSSPNNDAIFSYASSGAFNELMLHDTDDLALVVNNLQVESGLNIRNSTFRMIGASWTNSDGRVTISEGGSTVFSNTGYKTGVSLTAGGNFALGVDQDAVNGGYDQFEGHKADYAELFLYDRVLKSTENIIVNNYLSAKYNLTLGANDFYAHDASGFDFEVAGIGQVSSTDFHADAKGSGLFRMNSVSNLGNGEYLFWGHENGDFTTWTTTEAPNGGANIQRLAREWRVDETGDVGTVDVTIDASTLPVLPFNFSMYVLLVDSDGDFTSGAKVHEFLLVSGTTYEFSGYDITDGDYLAIGIVNPQVTHTLSASSGFESANASISVDLNFIPSEAKTVEVSTADGTATAPSDYTALSSFTVTFPAGSDNQTYSVSIVASNTIEDAETFTTTLSNPSSGLNLGSTTVHTYTINNTDFAIGPGGVGSVVDMVMWVRPEELDGTASGALISNWPDISGRGNDLVQTESDNFKPQYNPMTTPNGYGVVTFDQIGTDVDRLIHNNFTDFPTTDYTSFSVTRTAVGSPASDLLFSYASSADDNDWILGPLDPVGVFVNASLSQSASVDIKDQNFHVLSTTWTNSRGALIIWKDGDFAHSVTGFKTGATMTPGGNLSMAAEQDAINGGYDDTQVHEGDYAEFTMYNTFLNTAQNIIVQNYLSAKYNIAMTQYDFYAHDASANGSFYLDVAGIGQFASSDIKHTYSRGTGIVTMSNPSGLGNDEYLFWGSDNSDVTTTWNKTNVPNGGADIFRLSRTWRMDETGDVGTVDIRVDAASLPAQPVDHTMYVLLVDSDNDFTSGASIYELALEAGTTYKYSGLNVNDDDYFAIGVINPKVAHELEMSSGDENTNATINVSLNFIASEAKTVEVTTADGSAKAPSDYTALSSSLVTISAGSSTGSYTVTIISSADFEVDETFTSTIANPISGLNIGTIATHTRTITGVSIGHTGPGGVGASATNVLWVRPEEIASNTDGAKLNLWTDVSGNSHNLTQSGSTDIQPTYTATGVDSGPSVRFAQAVAAERLIHNNFTAFPTNAFTSYIVAKTSASTSSSDAILSYASTASPNDLLIADTDAINAFIVNQASVSTVNVRNVGDYILMNRWENVLGDYSVWRDGAQQYSVTSFRENQSFTVGGNLALAGEQDAINGSYDQNQGHVGDYGEVILYKTNLNDAQNIIVQNYLSAKFGIALTANDVFAHDGTHGNEVAGIGRKSSVDFHNDAQGKGVVRFNDPNDLEDNEYLMWGHDGAVLKGVSADVPLGVSRRFERVWRVSELSPSASVVDVGSVDITFDLTGLGNVTPSNLVLLIDADGVFASGAIEIDGAVDDGNGLYRFNDVSDVSDGMYFTLSSKDIVDTPLPVNLLSLECKVTAKQSVEIDWSTAGELDNSHFDIERSLNGRDFTRIGSVDGSGFTDNIEHYQYEDKDPLSGTSYYRLKQNDFSGTHEYTEILSVWIAPKTGPLSLVVYPNPAYLGDEVNIKITSDSDQVLLIETLNTLGLLKSSRQEKIVRGVNTIRLQNVALSRGLNIVKITDQNGRVKPIKLVIK